jgi:hypothetical protein
VDSRNALISFLISENEHDRDTLSYQGGNLDFSTGAGGILQLSFGSYVVMLSCRCFGCAFVGRDNVLRKSLFRTWSCRECSIQT